jgi:hypothetical protein
MAQPKVEMIIRERFIVRMVALILMAIRMNLLLVKLHRPELAAEHIYCLLLEVRRVEISLAFNQGTGQAGIA